MINPLSPLDGRYFNKVEPLSNIVSEFGLMKYRTQVEIAWLLFLSEKEFFSLSSDSEKKLQELHDNFTQSHYDQIKEIESTTNHDVKAVEYFLREYVPENQWQWIHFACTSEDINNLSYALMMADSVNVLSDKIKEISAVVEEQTNTWKEIPMLCRTHGQTASPSTMGKEMLVYFNRIIESHINILQLPIQGKINGATGTYGAHLSAFPEADWIDLSFEFVQENLGLEWTPVSTQIESHDYQARILNEIGLLSSILIDLCRDYWGYISLGYFGQKTKAGEVGSSTMPHKVNPIDFENAEGNLKLARGIGRTLSDELPISRWQRDLTDSTLQRNFGLVFGHFLLALESLHKGLLKVEIKPEIMLKDLQSSPEVLTEAVQTVMRAHGHADAYDQLKEFSRGKALSFDEVQDFVKTIDIPEEAKQRLLDLTPETYTGLATEITERYFAEIAACECDEECD